MRLLLCCDATADGGLGHFFRCIALAEEARSRGWEIWLAGSLEVPIAVETCRRIGIEPIPTDVSDGEAIREVAVGIGADVVHVDSYAAPGDLLDILEGSGILLSSVEDGAFGRRPAHVVIDPSAGAEFGHRPFDGAGALLRGLSFAPLRPAVRDSGGWEGRHEPPRVLVVMGGTDALAVSEQIAAVLLRTLDDVEVHVVVAGGRTTMPEALGAAVLHEASDGIVGLLTASDLVVTGAGTTIWELCHLGVPMAVVRLVANQDENYRAAVAAGVALDLGAMGDRADPAGLAFGDLGRLLADESQLRAMSGRSRGLVDGEGVVRISDRWSRDAPLRPGLTLRSAEGSDASALFHWRNEPAVRAVSRATGELGWTEHLAWLRRRLDDPGTILLIAAVDGRPAGQVRFDRRGVQHWEVSIAVDPGSRGRGIGPAMLTEAEAALHERDGRARVDAVVGASNTRSIRLFDGAGYRRDGEAGGWVRLTKTLP